MSIQPISFGALSACPAVPFLNCGPCLVRANPSRVVVFATLKVSPRLFTVRDLDLCLSADPCSCGTACLVRSMGAARLREATGLDLDFGLSAEAGFIATACLVRLGRLTSLRGIRVLDLDVLHGAEAFFSAAACLVCSVCS